MSKQHFHFESVSRSLLGDVSWVVNIALMYMRPSSSQKFLILSLRLVPRTDQCYRQPLKFTSSSTHTMAIAVGSYDVDGFNSLPDFGDVGPLFDLLGSLDIVATKMMPLFRGHGVEYDLRLTLLHRHFELGDGERLTDIRGTSVPVGFETGIPYIWVLQGGEQGQLRPMEFSIEKTKAPLWNQPKLQAFLREFA